MLPLQRLSHFMSQLGMRLRRLCLPPLCLLCGSPGQFHNICISCERELPILPQSCRMCGFFLQTEVAVLMCGFCLRKKPAMDATFVLYPYQGHIEAFIVQLKFYHALPVASLLGELLVRKILRSWYQQGDLPDLILPVPLHTKRLQERGFNQSIEIARYVAKQIGLPLDVKGVERRVNTQAQSGLKAMDRQRNIKNAFVVHGHYAGKTIAILDDVVTTGSTVRELAATLKKHHAKSVHIWTCARR